MIKFFRNRKSSIYSLILPDFGWAKQKDEKNIIQWVNPEQTNSYISQLFQNGA